MWQTICRDLRLNWWGGPIGQIMFDKLVENAPQLVILGFIVVQFLRHIGRSERRYDSLVTRFEEVVQRNTEALGASAVLLEKTRLLLEDKEHAG